ncbi:MAG: DNA replication/repair protein RecF [Firmicutes bacterium]|nr:DNA replication/repair protein RecF [Bacillota bacterium]
MRLRYLKVDNFRNYAAEELYWDEQINLLHGLNAQGKSNLLEAVCYLGIATSFRGAAEQELIRWGEDYFFLAGQVEREREGRLDLSAAANRCRQRRWRVNGEPRHRLSDVVGLLHTVIFAPEDIQLVKAGPDSRRRFLNQLLSQLDQDYCRLLISYNRVLRQRSALLKQWEWQDGEKAAAQEEQLSLWDRQLIDLGAPVALRRQQTIARLSQIAADLHRGLSGGEELALVYENSACPHEQAADAEQIKESFRTELDRVARSERQRGLSLSGPHRDEISVLLDGKPARSFGSQGQQRTAALSLKLAELELAREVRGEYPVLLLDDVLSELDAERRRAIMRLAVGKTQTFITAVEGDLPRISGKKWLVEAGRVTGGR